MAFNTAAALACIVSFLFAATSAHAAAADSGEWVSASATYFGTDAWSIHSGSCMFGYICPNRWSSELAQGWDVVAISDQNSIYSGNMQGSQCGKCLTIRCTNGDVKDGFGDTYERKGLCKNTAWQVKVKIVDTCLCNEPDNAESNKRWCCSGDDHIDVSKWALDKLVDDSDRWGVYQFKYKLVDCDASISNEAPNIKREADPHADMRKGTDCSKQGGDSKGSTSSSSSANAGSSGSGSSSAASSAGSGSSSASSSYSSRGGLTSESTGGQTRAMAGGYKYDSSHSRKWNHRRQRYIQARGHKHSKGWYWQVVKWYKQFNKYMKKTWSNGTKSPFGRR